MYKHQCRSQANVYEHISSLFARNLVFVLLSLVQNINVNDTKYGKMWVFCVNLGILGKFNSILRRKHIHTRSMTPPCYAALRALVNNPFLYPASIRQCPHEDDLKLA